MTFVHGGLLPQPDGSRDHEDVRAHDLLEDLRPCVALPAVMGHIRIDAVCDVVVHRPEHLHGHTLLLHDGRRDVYQPLGVGRLGRALQRTVQEQCAQVGEVPWALPRTPVGCSRCPLVPLHVSPFAVSVWGTYPRQLPENRKADAREGPRGGALLVRSCHGLPRPSKDPGDARLRPPGCPTAESEEQSEGPSEAASEAEAAGAGAVRPRVLETAGRSPVPAQARTLPRPSPRVVWPA
jgi:hypothetical protein